MAFAKHFFQIPLSQEKERLQPVSDLEVIGNFTVLPSESIIEILSFLTPKELAIVARLSSAFRNLAYGDELWKPLCLGWGIENGGGVVGWKENLKSIIAEQKRAEQQAAKRCWEETKYERSSFAQVKKGSYAILKGRPCKVFEIKVSKPGKHGATKYYVAGLDIFTSARHEQVYNSNARPDESLVVERKEDCPVLDFPEPDRNDGLVSVLLEAESKDLPIANDTARNDLRTYWNESLTDERVTMYATILTATWNEGKNVEEGVVAIIKKIEEVPFYRAPLLAKAVEASSEQKDRQDALQGLPSEIVLVMMSFLTPKDLAKVSLLNSGYRVFAQDESLWKALCVRHGFYEGKASIWKPFKELFKKCYLEKKEKEKKQKAHIARVLSRVKRVKSWDMFRLGNVVILDSRPCKIVDMHYSPCNSHGSAKLMIEGVDLFTQRKRDRVFRQAAATEVPLLCETDYLVLDVIEEPANDDTVRLTLVDPDPTHGDELREFVAPRSDPHVEKVLALWQGSNLSLITVQKVTWGTGDNTQSEERIIDATLYQD